MKRLLSGFIFSTAAFSTSVFSGGSGFEQFPNLYTNIRFATELAIACPSEHVSAYQSWREHNHIDEIDIVMDALLAKDKKLRSNIVKADKAMKEKVSSLGSKSCVFLGQILTSEEYQPATHYKDLMDKLLAIAPQVKALKEKEKEKESPLDPVLIQKDLAKVETVLFDKKVVHSYGMILNEAYPILLFENGEACKDMKALVFPGGVEAHKAKYPKRWTQWRKSWGDYEWLKGDKWKAFAYDDEYPAIEKGFRLNNKFHYIGGSSTGDSTVTTIRNFQFFSDGRFISGAQVYASTEISDTSSTFNHVSPDQKGQYEIDGYLLTLRYDSGETRYRAIVLDAKDPSPIWLNGDGYVE